MNANPVMKYAAKESNGALGFVSTEVVPAQKDWLGRPKMNQYVSRKKIVIMGTVRQKNIQSTNFFLSNSQRF